MSTILKIIGAILSMVLLYASAHARAETVIDTGKTQALFKCDHKSCTPVEANNEADSHMIERCQPKVSQTPDGKDVATCSWKVVVKKINPNTGATTWKNK
jgi:hypothetical protein